MGRELRGVVAAFFGCMLRGSVAVPMDKIAAPDFALRVTADVEAKLIVCSTELSQHCAGHPHLELETLLQSLSPSTLPSHILQPRSRAMTEPR